MSYFYQSKSLANSFLFILPLLILYEVGIALQDSKIKNTADVIVKTPLALFGKNSSLIFNLLVIIFLIASIFYIEKEYQLSILVFIPMIIESMVYALFISYGIGFIVYKIVSSCTIAIPFSLNIWMGIILSIGAGVYEEIVFRLILITSLYFLFAVLLKINKPISAALSILIGAFLFTIMHYVGTLGDTFTYTNFTFRMLSGIVLSAIFLSRGLGIAVYTHAIYDVFTVLKPFYA
ncbi:MAG: CPBP family intramembrane metalloprotease [Candidatus Jettenia sp. CY-1]|nr:CPBP family intramembrane metalloprotease [Candidatus Jettenia sp.]WKZ17802.1 MAG: CPBP family intramembrane metalloprotease [Candidatus Jettenia sp. CY-1]